MVRLSVVLLLISTFATVAMCHDALPLSDAGGIPKWEALPSALLLVGVLGLAAAAAAVAVRMVRRSH